MPVEAFPDLTNNQVTVVTDAPSMPPTEVEQLVTYPIEQAMMGMPKQQEVRSLSKLGLSIITVVFDDSVSMYFARQMVNERLQQVTDQLPNASRRMPSLLLVSDSRTKLEPIRCERLVLLTHGASIEGMQLLTYQS